MSNWVNKFDVIHEYMVIKDTRLFNYEKTIEAVNYEGEIEKRPDMEPVFPAVTKKKGELLRLSTKHELGMGIDNAIRSADDDDEFFRYVTDDPSNGDAANLYVKVQGSDDSFDLEIVTTGISYTVIDGDNLSKISMEINGSARNREVEEIYQINKRIIGNDKNLIHPGQILLIPVDFGSH